VILRRWASPVVMVAVPSILILPILISGKMLYGADEVSVFYYSRIVIADAFRSGRLPVWDPHVMCGFPLLAAVQGAVFYPPTWLCVVLSAGAFWTLSALVHMSLSGFFARLWLRHGLGVGEGAALVGGFVYMMSGYIVGHLYAGHVNYIWAYPWIPALLWRLERYLAGPTIQRGVLLAVSMAMLFLAGVPQLVLFTILFILARGLQVVTETREEWKDRSKIALRSLAWALLGLGLCAPQLFPTLELVGQMQRGATEDPEFLRKYSLAPNELIRLGIQPPTPQDWSGDSVGWETCGYVGAATFLLMGAAFAGKHPQRRLWGIVAVLSLLLALGTHTPLYRAFVFVVPGAGMFRGPGRYLLPFTVAVVGLTALGYQSLWSDIRRGYRMAAAILAVVVLLQLVSFGREFFRPVDMRSYDWADVPVASHKRMVGLEGRVASARGAPIWIVGKCQAGKLDQVCGYEPMMLRRFAELINAARDVPIGTNFPVLGSVAPHPIFDMLAVQLWMDGAGWHERNTHALARAWVVSHAVVFQDREERLQQMYAGRWDPRATVILEEFPEEAPPVVIPGSAGSAKVVSRAPGEYVLEAENGADAYLVLSEAFYPGWRAQVDGKPTDVLPANHLIQAIRLPAGKHHVRFAYRSRFLGAGFAVALLAALVPLGLSWQKRWRASAATSAAPSTGGS
jgi:hypothetical protein